MTSMTSIRSMLRTDESHIGHIAHLRKHDRQAYKAIIARAAELLRTGSVKAALVLLEKHGGGA